jgi:hypothetical protein
MEPTKKKFGLFDFVRVDKVSGYSSLLRPGATGRVVLYVSWGNTHWDIKVVDPINGVESIMDEPDLSLLEKSGKIPEFKDEDRVIVKHDSLGAFDNDTCGTISEIHRQQNSAFVFSNGRGSWVYLFELELRISKPAVKVNPKDIIVDREAESIWNPYPFKEKEFYGQLAGKAV